MYRHEMPYYASVAESYPMMGITVSSIKFSAGSKTAGVVKFFSNDKSCTLLYDPEWNKEKECYDWKNAVTDNHVFKCAFKADKNGNTFVMFPGAYGKVKNEAGEWVDKVDANGKKVWKDRILLLDRMGINRNHSLRAVLTAMIDAKAGTFKYATDQDEDHYFAYRKVREGEETASGYKGVRYSEVEKLREEGVKVYTRPAVKSCSNCSNCVRLWESDDEEDGVPGLPSRPVSKLVEEGPVEPCHVCLAQKKFVDIDAADYINEITREDNDSYITSNGYRRKVRYDEVVIDRYIYGSRDVLVSQRWEGDDEDGEPIKEYVEEDYDDVTQVAMKYEDVRTMRMAAIADECPMWIKMDKATSFYEWPEAGNVAIYGYEDDCWTLLDTDAKVKTFAKELKIMARCHSIEATYFKKSPLERQYDFLREFDAWVISGDMSDKEKINGLIKTFYDEQPVKGVKNDWIAKATVLCTKLQEVAKTDDVIKGNVRALIAKLLSNN